MNYNNLRNELAKINCSWIAKTKNVDTFPESFNKKLLKLLKKKYILYYIQF